MKNAISKWHQSISARLKHGNAQLRNFGAGTCRALSAWTFLYEDLGLSVWYTQICPQITAILIRKMMIIHPSVLDWWHFVAASFPNEFAHVHVTQIVSFHPGHVWGPPIHHWAQVGCSHGSIIDPGTQVGQRGDSWKRLPLCSKKLGDVQSGKPKIWYVNWKSK